jgi:hypothetical protein
MLIDEYEPLALLLASVDRHCLGWWFVFGIAFAIVSAILVLHKSKQKNLHQYAA